MEDILVCGQGYAIVRKRIGEVCESGVIKNGSISLIERLRSDLESSLGGPLPFVEAVHRLDQPVSGCVIIATDKDIFTELSRQFNAGTIRKRYLAVVEKPSLPLSSDSGRLQDWITFDPRSRKARIVKEEDAKRFQAKKAIMEWKLIGEGDRYLFLTAEPKTGRTHQIRAQLAAQGLIIKGDLKYGAKRSEPAGGIRLHAHSVQFKDPTSGDVVSITCDPPVMDPLWSAFLQKYHG